MKHIVKLFECAKCGQRYPIIPYYRAAAPHGPNKDCSSQEWIEVVEEHPAASDA